LCKHRKATRAASDEILSEKGMVFVIPRKKKRTVTIAMLVTSLILLGMQAVAYSKQIELEFLVTQDQRQLNFHAEAVSMFEKDNPDIKVNITVTDIVGQKLRVMLAGGAKADAYMNSHTAFQAKALEGLFMDLMPFIAKDRSFQLDRFFASAIEAHRVGKALYGLGFMGSPTLIRYNRDLFDEAGVSYPRSDWTWDDLIVKAKKMSKDTSGDGSIDQFGYCYSNLSHYNRWPVYVLTFGGQIWSPEGTRMVLDNLAAIEALEFARDLHYAHQIAAHPKITSVYEDRRAAMTMNGRYFVAPPDLNDAVAHLPLYNGNRATTLVTSHYSMLIGTKYPEEVWRLIKYLAVNCTKAGILDQYVSPVPSYMPNARAMLKDPEGRNEIAWLEAMDYAVQPFVPPISDWSAIQSRYFTQFRDGQISARVLAEGLTRDVNLRLAEVGILK
jgi:multiple sugar transport system substrate-binding protein